MAHPCLSSRTSPGIDNGNEKEFEKPVLASVSSLPRRTGSRPEHDPLTSADRLLSGQAECRAGFPAARQVQQAFDRFEADEPAWRARLKGQPGNPCRQCRVNRRERGRIKFQRLARLTSR